MLKNELPINIDLPANFLEREERCGYTISPETKEIWAVELDLLCEFIKVCNKHNLQYFASCGTLLGAMRHGGYIPWDDDVDLMMMRPEYEKLCAIANEEFNGRYFWQTEQTDRYSGRGHAQLRNSETTGILRVEESYKYHFNQGIFIDIFPLDNLPDDDQELHLFFTELIQKMTRFHKERAITYGYHWRSHLRKNLVLFLKELLKHYSKELFQKHLYDRYFEDFEKCLKRYNNENTQRVLLTPFVKTNCILKKEDFKEYKLQPFEFLELPIPLGYDSILTTHYKDWHTFAVGGGAHGDVLFDPHQPYTNYI